MPEDLTIAVVRGLSWEALRPYAVSLTRTGFKGTKLVFVENISAETRHGFTRLGFTLVDRVTPPSELHPEMPPDWAYGVYRFAPVVDYLLQARVAHFRYIIWTDVRDVIFQTNPSDWLKDHLEPNRLVVAGLGHAIKDCPWNDPWVRAAHPPSHGEVRECEAVACGTFAGYADAMLELFKDMYDGCMAANHPHATDQGMLNYLMRCRPYDKIARIPRTHEAFSAQWFPEKDKDPAIYPDYGFPVFDRTGGTVLTQAGLPFCVVHLYDRDPNWVAIMKAKYAQA